MTQTALLRLPDVIERTTLSKSEIYRRIAAGTFPRQRKISTRKAVWSEAEINTWIQEQLDECAA
tara:strand:+ start:303 stop:494 length:192 start_codon:yes stop_codon:yes gene_type:complete